MITRMPYATTFCCLRPAFYLRDITLHNVGRFENVRGDTRGSSCILHARTPRYHTSGRMASRRPCLADSTCCCGAFFFLSFTRSSGAPSIQAVTRFGLHSFAVGLRIARWFAAFCCTFGLTPHCAALVFTLPAAWHACVPTRRTHTRFRAGTRRAWAGRRFSDSGLVDTAPALLTPPYRRLVALFWIGLPNFTTMPGGSAYPAYLFHSNATLRSKAALYVVPTTRLLPLLLPR